MEAEEKSKPVSKELGRIYRCSLNYYVSTSN
jgi:hypothetical protein